MLKLDYENTSLIDKKDFETEAKRLSPYINELDGIHKNHEGGIHESVINLPFDESVLGNIRDIVKDKKTPKLKYILLIGVGGSSLGTKAIYDAIFGFTDNINPNRFPKIIFIETNDGEYLSSIKNLLNEISELEEIVINIVSKSGKTTETIANTEILLGALKNRFHINLVMDRVVITTDKGSQLWEEALDKNISRLEIPKEIGGRFSVFTYVSIFPLALSGINISELLRGGRQISEECLNTKIEDNPAASGAVVLYCNHKKGINISTHFIFHPELESLGKWYTQLLSESIGKEKNNKNKVVHSGITPIISIGSTDLHSIGQLYLGGPKDKVTTFVASEKSNNTNSVPKDTEFDLIEEVKGKSAGDIMDAILLGVESSYKEKKLSFMELSIGEINEKTLGEFLQYKIFEVLYLGHLFSVNVFDQPSVDDYKEKTKTLLGN